MDGYWQVVADKGRETNPYRAGFLQLVVVAENDARAEEKYARHVEYFYHKCLHVPAPWFSPPGNQDYRSLTATLASPIRRPEDPKTLRSTATSSSRGYVIAGSPATVRDRLEGRSDQEPAAWATSWCSSQIGSMPHELAHREHRPLRARGPARNCAATWNDEGWTNHWWPERLRGPRRPRGPAPARWRAAHDDVSRTIAVWQNRDPHARALAGPAARPWSTATARGA